MIKTKEEEKKQHFNMSHISHSVRAFKIEQMKEIKEKKRREQNVCVYIYSRLQNEIDWLDTVSVTAIHKQSLHFVLVSLIFISVVMTRRNVIFS